MEARLDDCGGMYVHRIGMWVWRGRVGYVSYVEVCMYVSRLLDMNTVLCVECVSL